MKQSLISMVAGGDETIINNMVASAVETIINNIGGWC